MNQIKTALPPPPARVVDAGGGTGQVAVPLAGLGYELTVVDTSPAMLATCAERAAEEGGATLALVQGDAAEVAALLGPASQDAVLCHDLLGDVAEPAGLLAALVEVLGVGIFAAGASDDLDRAALAGLAELERRVAGREPYRSSAHTLHLIGRRQTPLSRVG